MRRAISRRSMQTYRWLPFFNQIPAREQDLLLRFGTELIVPPRAVVASSAHEGRQCTLLVTGSFTWSEPDLSGSYEPTRRLNAGDFVDEGVLSWFCSTEDGPGAFLVHACTESRVLVYHRSEFAALVQQAPRTRSLVASRTAAHLAAWGPQGRRSQALGHGDLPPTRPIAESPFFRGASINHRFA
jgi:hypothetical protein